MITATCPFCGQWMHVFNEGTEHRNCPNCKRPIIVRTLHGHLQDRRPERALVKVAVGPVSTCTVLSSEPMRCPLCATRVPPMTVHSCQRADPKTAREKFRKGQRVRLAGDYNRDGRGRRGARTGIVAGFGRQPVIVRVRRDTSNYPEAWHMSRWEGI